MLRGDTLLLQFFILFVGVLTSTHKKRLDLIGQAFCCLNIEPANRDLSLKRVN